MDPEIELPDGEEEETDEEAEAAEEAQLFNLLHKSDSDRMVKRTPKEETLQAAAQALVFEYGFDLGQLERAFTIKVPTVSQATGKVTTRRPRLDIAVFTNGIPHTQDKIIRAGIVATPGTKSDDESRGIRALDNALGALPACEFGFWTNGEELAVRRKVVNGTWADFQDVADMPAAGESYESLLNQRGRRRLIASTADTLAQTFQRCHNYIYSTHGKDKSRAFWAFLRLIFCKMYDEQREALGRERRFWVGLTERFTPEGRAEIQKRISELFEEVKGKGSVPSEYAGYFAPNETIDLNDMALAYVASELSRYDLLSSSEDAKGLAYEILLDRKRKNERGQFFTPRNVIRLMVEMLDPGEDDYILDPACGTGGFLVIAFRHVRKKIEERLRQTWADPDHPTNEETAALRQAAREWAEEHIWGMEFDEDLVKVTQMNLAMNGAAGRVYNVDSLRYPRGETDDLPRLVMEQQARYSEGDEPVGALGSFTLCFTNPPFGSKLPFTDRTALLEYELALAEQPTEGIQYSRKPRKNKSSLPPEILFVERCVKWVRPGGKVGIVVPDGILGNPKDQPIRRWILSNCDVLASIDMPVETFLPQVGVQPSLLFLERKTEAQLDAEGMGTRADPMVFMAIVDRVGKDRRGNLIYKRNPDGTDVPPLKRTERRTAFRDGEEVTVEIHIEEPLVDDDLPDVLTAWQHFQRGEMLQ